MTVQTTYDFGLKRGHDGQLVDNNPHHNHMYTVASAFGFGRAVTQGANDTLVNLATTGARCVGVAQYAAKGSDGAVAASYAVGETASIIDFGRILVQAVGAVTKDAPAYVISTVGADQGKFTATSNAMGIVGRFAETNAAGGQVAVDITINTQ